MLITADFPTWFRAGCYGGLGCSLLVAAGVATYALARRRGTPRQLAGAMLGCLAAAVCILPAIIWSETRLDLQGPALSVSEVLLWLAWVAVIGWMLPLGISAGFLLLAPPFDTRQLRQRQASRRLRSVAATASSAERQHEPLGPEVPWGRLIHQDEPYANRQIALSRQIVLLGRERDNDILLETDLASRYHAELRLERGRAYLLDRGSMNGTSVNGQKIWGLMPLQDGDLLEVGGQHFRYEDLFSQAQTSAKAGTPPEGERGEGHDETARLVAVVAQPPPANVASGTLLLSGGAGAGQVFALSKAVLTIGRDSGCDITISDASISRQHAQIIRQEMGWYLQDLGSRNGTAINGQRLSAPQRVEDGDVLTIGNIPLRYLAERPREEAAVPEEPVTETLPTSSQEPAAEEITTATPTQALPPKTPTVPLRGREHPRPLRLPTRPLEPSPAAPEQAPEPKSVAPAELSNHVFRPHRLVADRAFLAPLNPPQAEQASDE
ncbi:MAG TPA: FHA domain-containing protein [Ktedonobacterales bacterium]|nr:FHA domain-containing protein [Ktedonobacterales bacterium]